MHCTGRPAKIFGSYQKIGNRTLPAVAPAEPCDLPDKPPPAKSATANLQPLKKGRPFQGSLASLQNAELRGRKVRVDAKALRCPAAPDRQGRVPAELAH